MLECSCHIISYLADVMNALRQSNGQGTSALVMEGEEKAMEVDSDWVEELAVEEDDSQAEDSVRSHPFVYSYYMVEYVTSTQSFLFNRFPKILQLLNFEAVADRQYTLKSSDSRANRLSSCSFKVYF